MIIFRTLVRLWTYLRTETALPQFLFMYVDSEWVILPWLFIAFWALMIIDHDQHKNWINKLSLKQRENDFARERSSQICTQLNWQSRKQIKASAFTKWLVLSLHNIFVNSAVPILQRSWVRILFESSFLFFLTACNKMIFSSETWITMTKLYFYYLNSWMTSAREVTQYLQRQKRMSLLLRYEFEKYKMPFLVSIDYFRIPHNTLCLPPKFCMLLSSNALGKMQYSHSYACVLRGSSRVPAALTLVE